MPVTTAVQVCNMALLRIGEEPIVSLDEPTKVGRTLRIVYPQKRDELLIEIAPAFAIVRQVLAVPETTNLTRYTYKYKLPEDPVPLKFLELTDSNGGDYRRWPFEIEGSALFTNIPAAVAKYIRQVEDVRDFSDPFVRALYLVIAAEASYHISGSPRMDIAQEADSAIDTAKKENAVQMMTNRRPSRSWAAARRG